MFYNHLEMEEVKVSELFTISEAAERMHVSRQTIYTWIKEGKIKAVLTPGGRSRIPEDQLIIEKLEPAEGTPLDGFPIRDISDLYRDRDEPLGTKEKYWFWRTEGHWYWDCEGERFLFKAGREGTGDNWAEKVASELCRLLGLPHAEYDLAVYGDLKGVITPNFVPEGGARFEAGNEILAKYIGGYEMLKRYKQTQHTLRVVLAVLGGKTVKLPIGWPNLGGFDCAADVFVGYLMLDAWIANQDRHHENWGRIIVPDNTITHLAPTFDHASSLGRNETDSIREERLRTRDSSRNMDKYVQRARSALYHMPKDSKPLSTLEAFREAAVRRPEGARFWLSKLEQISSPDTSLIIDKVPTEEMSDIAKEFTQAILDRNRERLLTTEV